MLLRGLEIDVCCTGADIDSFFCGEIAFSFVKSAELSLHIAYFFGGVFYSTSSFSDELFALLNDIIGFLDYISD